MIRLRNRFVFSACRIAAIAVLVSTSSYSIYACNPSYAAQVTNDDMNVYVEANIMDPDGSVKANAIVQDPNGTPYELDGSWSNGEDTTYMTQNLGGLGGIWTDKSRTFDYGTEYDPYQDTVATKPPYVSISSHANPGTLHVNSTNGATCGQDIVQVYTFRGGKPWPTFTVSVAKAAGYAAISTWSNEETRTAASETTDVYPASNQICAISVGTPTSTATIRAEIVSVSGDYVITDPSPASIKDAMFTVSP